MRYLSLTLALMCGATALADPESDLLQTTIIKVDQSDNRLRDASYKIVEKRTSRRGLSQTEMTVIQQGGLSYTHGTRPVYVSRIPHVPGEAPKPTKDEDCDVYLETATTITNHDQAMFWSVWNQPDMEFHAYLFDNDQLDTLSERGESMISGHRPCQLAAESAGLGSRRLSDLYSQLDPATTPWTWHISGPDKDGVLRIDVRHPILPIGSLYSYWIDTKRGFLISRTESRGKTGELGAHKELTIKESNGEWYPSVIQHFGVKDGKDVLTCESTITEWVARPNKPDSQFSFDALSVPDGTRVFHEGAGRQLDVLIYQNRKLIPDPDSPGRRN